MDIPGNSTALLSALEKIYPDTFETDPTMVGTPEYWKRAGVIELLKMIRWSIDNEISSANKK
ncbi:MAG: hypothetical protein JHC33_07720 [Ignisphaera sp.]|nr:hypothetical protein [Ignisphaera sp.]